MISTILDLDTQTSYYYDSGYSGTSSPGSSYQSSGIMGSPASQTSDSTCSNFQELFVSDNLNIVTDDFNNVQHGGNVIAYSGTVPNMHKCYLEIIEQPVDKFRFRYKSEMHGTHGSLMGLRSSKTKKTYPTVELKGYQGKALIRCSLYQTGVMSPLPHSHQLVVRQNDRDMSDPHELEVHPDIGYRALFQGMGIIHTAKKYITEALIDKKKKIKEFHDGSPCTLKELTQLKVESDQQAKRMNLNQVRLCFEAYKIHEDGNLEELCSPVFSKPINNMKSALTGELKISRLSACVSSSSGGDDLFLFVEKVGKKNIKVKFFELNDEEEIVWEDYGIFAEADVHHQFAIALRTPPYRNRDIEKSVDVFIQLLRPSDGDLSEPLQFKYKPRDIVSSRKRARTSSSSLYSSELPEPLFMRDDNSGTTISEEYNKNYMICDLLNTDKYQSSQFLDSVKKDSEELLKLIDPQVFDDTIDFEPKYLQTDGAAALKTDPIKSENKKNIMRNIIRTITTGDVLKQRNALIKYLNDASVKDEDILHNIIINKNIGEGIKLLKHIDNLKAYEVLQLQDKCGNTCLHIACAYDRPEFIRPLINLGIDTNIQNIKGNTALHIAVRENMSMSATKILEKQNYTNLSIKLNVDLANYDGFTPLHLAVREKNLDMVKKLLEIGNASVKIAIAKNGNNVLHLAVEQNNEEIIKYLLDNTSVKINQPNTYGFTPLALAQSIGKDASKIVKLLLEKGGISNMENKNITEFKRSSFITDDSCSTSSESGDELQIDESENDKMDCIISEEFDDITIKELSIILKKEKKWKNLAEMLKLDEFMWLWTSPESMLRYINNSQDVTVQKVLDKLKECQEIEAVKCIERMQQKIIK